MLRGCRATNQFQLKVSYDTTILSSGWIYCLLKAAERPSKRITDVGALIVQKESKVMS